PLSAVLPFLYACRAGPPRAPPLFPYTTLFRSGAAGVAHRLLYDGRIEALAARAIEQRRAGRDGIRAEFHIGRDGLAHDGQDRHDALLAALAGNPQAVAPGYVLAVQPQRFAQAQPGTPEQGQDRGVARLQPGRGFGPVDRVDHLFRRRDAQRFRHAVRPLRRGDQPRCRIVDQAVALQAAEEAADRAQAPRQRGGSQTLVAALRQPGTEIRLPQAAQIFQARGLAEMAAQEGEEAAEILAIGAQGVFRETLFLRQPAMPGFGGGFDILGGEEIGLPLVVGLSYGCGRSSHERTQRPSTPATNCSSSVPWLGWNLSASREPSASMARGAVGPKSSLASASDWIRLAAGP